MSDTLFSSINTVIRIKETTLLTKEQFDLLLKAKDLDNALQLLKSTVYTDLTVDYEDGLMTHLVDSYREIIDELPDVAVSDIFSLIYVYHNLKVLLKQDLTGMTLEHLLIPIGQYSLKVLEHAVVTGEGELPEVMLEAIQQVKAEYSEYQRVEAIDVLLDRAYFDHLLVSVKHLQSSNMENMVKAWIDLYNIDVILRVEPSQVTRSYFLSVLANGGDIPVNQLIQLAMTKQFDVLYTLLMESPYAQAINVTQEQFTAFAIEKNRDMVSDYYLQNAKLEPFGFLPILSYFYYKEMEIKNLRLILTGKENGIDEQILRERIRPIYDI